jgi:phosphorylcholine metabolism protein LicD
MSVMGSTTCSRKPDPPSDVVICPSSAFINLKDYEIQELKSLSDNEFHAKMAELAEKYPNLKNAYGDLLECWNHYH